MSPESDLSLDQLVELERRAAEREAAEAKAAERAEAGGDEHHVLVLPWWQRPFNIGVLVVTAALLAGMVGWLIGDSGAQPDHDAVDVGFLHDMREHHEQAVYMGLIFGELEDTDPGLQQVATTIVRGQSLEVGRMIQLLRSFGEPEAREDGTPMDWMSDGAHAGHADMAVAAGNPDDPFTQMPGMATEDQLDALAAASAAEADALFVELMTAHHRGGIDMAAYAVEHATNDEVVKMAAGMVAAQEGEIVEMENLLR